MRVCRGRGLAVPLLSTSGRLSNDHNWNRIAAESNTASIEQKESQIEKQFQSVSERSTVVESQAQADAVLSHSYLMARLYRMASVHTVTVHHSGILFQRRWVPAPAEQFYARMSNCFEYLYFIFEHLSILNAELFVIFTDVFIVTKCDAMQNKLVVVDVVVMR